MTPFHFRGMQRESYLGAKESNSSKNMIQGLAFEAL